MKHDLNQFQYTIDIKYRDKPGENPWISAGSAVTTVDDNTVTFRGYEWGGHPDVTTGFNIPRDKAFGGMRWKLLEPDNKAQIRLEIENGSGSYNGVPRLILDRFVELLIPGLQNKLIERAGRELTIDSIDYSVDRGGRENEFWHPKPVQAKTGLFQFIYSKLPNTFK